MKKFILNGQYLIHVQLGYVQEEIKPLACANNLNTLMKSIENYVGKILQVRNSNFLEWKKWEVSRDGSHAEIIVISKDSSDCGDGVRFIIDEVDFLI